jgi:hypothetical protein
MKLRKSHFEHDANARWSIPSLSRFAAQDHLGLGRIVGPKSGTKWQLFGPLYCHFTTLEISPQQGVGGE